MAPTPTSLEGLPNELLYKCFTSLDASNFEQDIQNLRLTSKRLHTLASPLLIHSTTVFLSSPFLSRFEALSHHPIFSASIRTVSINVSYYCSALANDRALFARNSASNLYQRLETAEYFASFSNDEEEESKTDHVSPTIEEWEDLGKGGDGDWRGSERKKFLGVAFEEYRRRWEDQEGVMMDGMGLERICEALGRMSGLVGIKIMEDHRADLMAKILGEIDMKGLSLLDAAARDKVTSEKDVERERNSWDNFDDLGMMESCLIPSRWKGSFTTSSLTVPPVEIIPDLFQALAATGIRPSAFTIKLTPPNDLRCLQLTDTQRSAIRTVLSSARRLTCVFERWARKDSLAEDNSRPRDEMLALCSLTSAYFDAPLLEELTLSLEGYPAFYEIPQVNISDFLPLGRPWPHLQNLYLHHIPFRLRDLQILVTGLQDTLNYFGTKSGYLLDGSWITALDILRGLGRLEDCEVKYSHGAEFGDSRRYMRDVPEGEMREYVLRVRERNPLLDYGFHAS